MKRKTLLVWQWKRERLNCARTGRDWLHNKTYKIILPLITDTRNNRISSHAWQHRGIILAHEPISNNALDEEKVGIGNLHSEWCAYSGASLDIYLPPSVACVLCICLLRFFVCFFVVAFVSIVGITFTPSKDERFRWVFWQTCTLILLYIFINLWFHCRRHGALDTACTCIHTYSR